MIVSTTAFVQAAEVQSKALGHEPTIVWVPHPIQDRTDDELRALADSAFDGDRRKNDGGWGGCERYGAELTLALRGYEPLMVESCPQVAGLP